MDDWPVSLGLVTLTRVSVAQIGESELGSSVTLQPELQVSYAVNGANYTRWFKLPARSDLSRTQLDRDTATLIGTHVQVHWKRENPLDAYVTKELGRPTKPSAR